MKKLILKRGKSKRDEMDRNAIARHRPILTSRDRTTAIMGLMDSCRKRINCLN
ncbi:MAG TPA: hypothetical protein V6C95_16335 [Coleofasciculaceae cyanobacterium]